MKSGSLDQLIQNIADSLCGTPSKGGRIHEEDFEAREDFEAETKRRQSSVIIYDTEPLAFGVNLPKIDELPGADE